MEALLFPMESWLMEELSLPMESWLMEDPFPAEELLLMASWLIEEAFPMLSEDCAKAALALARERIQAATVRMRDM